MPGKASKKARVTMTVDPKVKEEGSAALARLGFSLSGGVEAFLANVARTGAMPFGDVRDLESRTEYAVVRLPRAVLVPAGGGPR